MLTPLQQQELINAAKMLDPLYLWSGSLDEFTPVPTPSTQTFMLDKINNQNIIQWAIDQTTMPLDMPNEPYIVNVVDHAYVNLNFEKQLFLSGVDVSIDTGNGRMRPSMKINWNLRSFLPSIFVLGKQMMWMNSFVHSNKHNEICSRIDQHASEIANHILAQTTLDTIEKDLEQLVGCILAIELIDNLMEQYAREYIKVKHLYEWDAIESYYWQKHRFVDLYYQSTYQVGAVNAGKKTKEEYLQIFGNRGIVDFELNSPRFYEVPQSVFSQNIKLEQYQDEKPLDTSVLHKMSAGDQKFLDVVWTVKSLRGTIRLKTLVGVAKLRSFLLQMAQQQSIGTDLIFYMTKEEVRTPQAFVEKAAERKEQYNQNMLVKLPSLLTREVIQKLTANHVKGEKLAGTPVSTGQCTGQLLFVTSPEMDPKEIENYIAVFPDGSPEYSMLYRHACGIIFQSGGAMSHGAIVAREYRIPAITLGGTPLEWEPKTKVSLNGAEGTLEIL